MPLPVPAATALVDETIARLNDPSATMDPGELRTVLAKLRRAQRDAQREELAIVFDVIGAIHFRLREFSDALDAHRNAARYDTTRAVYTNNVAACLIELKRFPEALAALRDARARPNRPPYIDLCILGNTAEIHHHRGEHDAARRAFEEAARYADARMPVTSFKLADTAALLGADDDAVEYFARSLAGASGGDLGETPAIEFVRAFPDHMRMAAQSLQLEAALARVAARYDAPIPPEHQLVTQVGLPSAALTAFNELLDHPPDPTERLRTVFGESRP